MRAPHDPWQQEHAGPDTFVDAISRFAADEPERPTHVDSQPWHLIYGIAYGSLVMPMALAIALWFKSASWHHIALSLLVTHLALVLSFLGGLHWGIAFRFVATNARMPAFHFIWGPIPGYVAWFSLMADPRVALVVMMALMAWTYWTDHLTWPGSGLGPWLPLRRVFTIGTLIYCAIAIAGLFR